jgi:hypothetical protein
MGKLRAGWRGMVLVENLVMMSAVTVAVMWGKELAD